MISQPSTHCTSTTDLDELQQQLARLDAEAQAQARIYRRLHELGKSLNETLQLDEVYNIATSFATHELGFEKCLIFEHDYSNGWFKIAQAVGYDNPMEQQVLKIISLLLSGEVIEYLRVTNKAIVHTQQQPNVMVEKLTNSLFLSECTLELFGGDIEIPHGLIIAGNGFNAAQKFSRINTDSMHMLALGNLIVQLSNSINNIIFYKAWREEKQGLEENILRRTQEITEQKQTFEAIFKTAKDGIAILDVETSAFVDANQAYLDMTGYSRDELLRSSSIKLAIIEDKVRTRQAIHEVVKNGHIKNFIQTSLTRSGERIITNMSIALMSDPTKILASVKDITAQKELEQNLIEEKQRAEIATQTKSMFLANMSHEIRTPMNAIIGMTHLALKLAVDDKQRSYIANANQAAINLLGILNDILDFSKIEAGKLELEQVAFRLEDVIEHSKNLLSFRAQDKGLTFVVETDENVPTALIGDPLRIGQILINLGNNAIKFTDRGGSVKIHVQLRSKTKKRATLVLAVSDTGIGISEEQQSKLFQSFIQADSSTTRKFGGTGLGLTICQSLAELMGGNIRISSSLGQGSTFRVTLTLPLQQGDISSREAETVSTGAQLDQHRAHLNQRKILLVEDNILNQKVAHDVLADCGIQLSIANNGQEALDKLAEQAFDAVLMDCQMPVMDGYTATHKIRAQAAFANLPVIAMTANAMSGDREKALQAGMDDYISKPIDIPVLIQTLAKWMPDQPASDRWGDHSGDNLGNNTAEGTAENATEVSPAPSLPSVSMTAPTTATGAAIPAQLAGIDIQQGLAQVGGKMHRYLKYLAVFVEENQDFADKLQQAEQANEAEHAQRLAHSLKSNAAGLGMKPLQQAALALETAYKQESTNTQSLKADTIDALQQVLSSINQLLDSHHQNQ